MATPPTRDPARGPARQRRGPRRGHPRGPGASGPAHAPGPHRGGRVSRGRGPGPAGGAQHRSLRWLRNRARQRRDRRARPARSPGSHGRALAGRDPRAGGCGTRRRGSRVPRRCHPAHRRDRGGQPQRGRRPPAPAGTAGPRSGRRSRNRRFAAHGPRARLGLAGPAPGIRPDPPTVTRRRATGALPGPRSVASTDSAPSQAADRVARFDDILTSPGRNPAADGHPT